MTAPPAEVRNTCEDQRTVFGHVATLAGSTVLQHRVALASAVEQAGVAARHSTRRASIDDKTSRSASATVDSFPARSGSGVQAPGATARTVTSAATNSAVLGDRITTPAIAHEPPGTAAATGTARTAAETAVLAAGSTTIASTNRVLATIGLTGAARAAETAGAPAAIGGDGDWPATVGMAIAE